jgi:hypothetical protein
MVDSKTVNSFGKVIKKATYGPTSDSQPQSDTCKINPGYWKLSDYNKCGTFGCYAPRTLN